MNVLIGVPLHAPPCDAYRYAKEEFIANQPRGHRFLWAERGGGGITVTRNMLAGKAIREKYDVMVFLAGDTGFPDNRLSVVVARALSHFERPEVNVVGGVYLFKSWPLRVALVQDRAREIDAHGLVEVKETGTDFLAIRVKAMEAVITKWPQVSQNLYGHMIPLAYDSNTANAEKAAGTEWNIFGQAVVWEDGAARFLPEDFYWCRLAREAGFRIQVDTRIRLHHYGSFNYDASTATGIEQAVTTAMPRWEPSDA